jgi:hypothetical protein
MSKCFGLPPRASSHRVGANGQPLSRTLSSSTPLLICESFSGLSVSRVSQLLECQFDVLRGSKFPSGGSIYIAALASENKFVDPCVPDLSDTKGHRPESMCSSGASEVQNGTSIALENSHMTDCETMLTLCDSPADSASVLYLVNSGLFGPTSLGSTSGEPLRLSVPRIPCHFSRFPLQVYSPRK